MAQCPLLAFSGHTRAADQRALSGVKRTCCFALHMSASIDGCFCNALQYVAHEMGVSLTSIEVDVTVGLEGHPLPSIAIRFGLASAAA